MSTLQDPTRDDSQATAPVGDGTVPRPRTAPERTSGWGRSVRWSVYAVAGVLVAGVGVLGVTRLGGEQQGTDAPPAAAADSNVALKDAPITLPATAGGKNPLGATDVTRRPEWVQQAKQAVHGAVFAAQTYGTPGSFDIVRIVAARHDLTGTLEMTWAGDAGTKVGPVSCTNTIRLTPEQPAKVHPTVMLCWRTSASLSVYVLVIDPKATKPVPMTDAADTVQSVWRSASNAA
jgi:hypothetical protein